MRTKEYDPNELPKLYSKDLQSVIASMFVKDGKRRPSCENLLGNKCVILYMSRKFAKLSTHCVRVGHNPSESPAISLLQDNPSAVESSDSHRIPTNSPKNEGSGQEGEQGKKKKAYEPRVPRIESTELATKDHEASYRKGKVSNRSDLDLFYKSHSENSHKKDKQPKVFCKDNSEHHDYKKDQLDSNERSLEPIPSYDYLRPYGQYGKGLMKNSFEKERLGPKEKGGKPHYLKRNDSEHVHGSRIHNTKPLSIERLAGIHPITIVGLRSPSRGVQNFEWSNLLMNSASST
eukprot:TRINITY_DN2601_c0_g1_i15.p1 TRINITY_DN2601_c0_g1~~TRINITY_DN2601_c0_g1_i15.p1  ORF type:complete len:290 (+),score=88.40 TRINITY_DN2601_c0_g1_i15:791-1660(+)